MQRIIFTVLLFSLCIFASHFNHISFESIDKEEKEFLAMLQKEHHAFTKKKRELSRTTKIFPIKKELKELEEKKRVLLNLIQKKIKDNKTKATLIKKIKPLFAKIYISTQRMKVYYKGKLLYDWKVFTGKRNHPTPRGFFKPIKLQKKYYSKQNKVSMPYSIFFHKRYAIHGTNNTKYLGEKASHGSIQLHTSHVKKLYDLISKMGRNNTTIRIVY